MCMRYVDYDTNICPYCAGKLIHPIIGHINKDEETYKLWLDSTNYCKKMEVIDDGGGTIGYTVCCRKVEYDKN